MLVVGIVIIFVFLFCISRMYAYDKTPVSAAPRKKAVQAAPKPVEKPIEQVIEEFRNGVKADARKEEEKWDATFLSGLPLEQHPDYIEISPTDEVDIHTIKSWDGTIVMESKTYYNKKGYQYSVRPDYITQTAKINHKSLTWTVPLNQVKK